ncbi:DUF485 domain-containing protein [Gandjariella thermophila]|uniref:DUF485 domain-containing protein n=1 Tax=Gandjariella thermophila TaxID=1931992 RepID=UPI001CEF73AB|nr:DUF485 domain-containing protein [Gandjariella thermophila]
MAGDLGFDGGEPRPLNYTAIQQSEEFAQLRRRMRRFVFPMTGLFLCWYMTYVLLAAFDHSLMNQKVVGQVNLGLILGVGQFISTILIMLAYLRYAKRNIDPRVEAIRTKVGVVEE